MLKVSRDLGKTSVHPVSGQPKQVNVAEQQHPRENRTLPAESPEDPVVKRRGSCMIEPGFLGGRGVCLL
jgi:hypothetical protein